ncbi:hypothetical protein [Luteolibacter soli]|uniref:DUF3592 domain-containing protein n=1 Tax=Luteolibacter soli TaxID=3135280 RepID=A0ABU9AWY3_9BACT
MTPRPPYQWKSFWLGVLVISFLGWGWIDSFQHPFHVVYARSVSYYQVFHVKGELVFRHGGGGTPGSGARYWIGVVSPSVSMAAMKSQWARNGQSTYCAISYPAIIGLTALCLGGLVSWRSRRWKNLEANNTQSP